MLSNLHKVTVSKMRKNQQRRQRKVSRRAGKEVNPDSDIGAEWMAIHGGGKI